MTFGEKLKQARIDKNLTQKELADKLHVTFQTVSKWENDENEPSFNTLKEIVSVLEIDVDYFFNDEKETLIDDVDQNESEEDEDYPEDDNEISGLPPKIFEDGNGVSGSVVALSIVLGFFTFTDFITSLLGIILIFAGVTNAGIPIYIISWIIWIINLVGVPMIASMKNRKAFSWFVLGFFFNPLAGFILSFLPVIDN